MGCHRVSFSFLVWIKYRVPALTPDDELPLGSDVHSAVRRGTVVVASCQVATQLVAVAILAVLYHQLGPQPYGYLGMVLPWILFLRIFASLGLNVAAVQKSSFHQSKHLRICKLSYTLVIHLSAKVLDSFD